MGIKTSFVVSLMGLGALVVACGSSNSSVVGSPSASTDGGAKDARFTFSPAKAPRACANDADCVILPALDQCGSCCGDGAVARGEAERAYQAVVDACRGPDAPNSMSCAMACGESRPACFDAMCVMLPASDAGAPASAACTNGGDALGTAVPDPGAGPACGARAVATGFEGALDPSWTATDPSAFRIDSDTPIAGASSLRISYRQENAYLTIAQPDACAIRVAFTLRTHLLTSGITLARIAAGTGSWFHVRLEACQLSVAEETRTSDAAGLAVGAPLGAVPDDAPVRVVLTIDLRDKTLSTALAPLGSPLPPATATPIRTSATTIGDVELGAAPGIQSGGVGTVWIDDLAID